MIQIQKPHYEFEASPDALIFEFDSVSESQTIKKVVVYDTIEGIEELYQLAFGNLTEDGGIDFMTENKNKDRDKILATVAQTLLIFFKTYPNKKVYFAGSTPKRTRFYRSIISKFIEIIELYFHVVGLDENLNPEKFVKDRNYTGFVIYEKK
jgi:hypothetical protein